MEGVLMEGALLMSHPVVALLFEARTSPLFNPHTTLKTRG